MENKITSTHLGKYFKYLVDAKANFDLQNKFIFHHL